MKVRLGSIFTGANGPSPSAVHPRACGGNAYRTVPVWSKYSNAQRVSSLHVYRHHERNHPGKENLLLFPTSNQLSQSERKVHSRERLGKLLHFYHREAA